ncbi:MAG: acyltransferase [Oscillospiraceae bacterium]
MKKQRNYGIDLTRAVAISFVLAVHSFLYNGFYSEPLQGIGMAAGTVLRMAFVSAVPLFLILTGYLCVGRTWSRGYYRKLLPVLLTYLLAAAVCLAFRLLWLKEEISALGVLRRVLDFSAAPYGWYVEMYIGLFLLTPFLNAAWRALEERGKKALLISLIVMTALPALVNLRWQIIPDWWTEIYPLTYYVLGAWLREHPVKVKRLWLLLGWIGLAAVAGLVQYAAQQALRPGQPFYSWNYNYRASLLTLAQTVCLFSCLRQFDGSRTPAPVRWCVDRVARLTLPIHLVSYAADMLIYPVLCAAVPTVNGRMACLPLMVLINLVISGLAAWVLDWVVNAVMGLIQERKEVPVSSGK